MKSTDTNLKIYISEAAREELFKKMQKTDDADEIKYLLSAENLEQICLGKTYLLDYAYGQIRRLLKQEFKQWLAEQYNDYLRGGEVNEVFGRDELNRPIDMDRLNSLFEDSTMTKDEMKNRISLALKDPVLQQGFEIICKENTDLKASNEEWRRTCEAKSDTNFQLTEQLADKIEKITELERFIKTQDRKLRQQSTECDKAINRVEILNKEIAAFKTVKIPQLERKIASIRGAHSADCKKLNARIEQVKRLKEENATLKAAKNTHELRLSQDILSLWESTVCEIRREIKAQETPALIYAKELCDKLEHSMRALAGGKHSLKYSISD